MPMLKKETQGSPETKGESGLDAAVDRLTKAVPVEELYPTQRADGIKAYKPRDFDAEARGKTRCALFAAALQSPGLAGMKWKTPEEFLALAEKIAAYGVRYSFQD